MQDQTNGQPQQLINIDQEVEIISGLFNDLFVKMKGDGYESATQPVMNHASQVLQSLRGKVQTIDLRFQTAMEEVGQLRHEHSRLQRQNTDLRAKIERMGGQAEDGDDPAPEEALHS